MKKRTAYIISFAARPRLARAFAVVAMALLSLGFSPPVQAADGTTPVGKAQADLLAAEKEFEQTGKEFGGPAANPAQNNSSQHNGQLSWSEAAGGKAPTANSAPAQNDPRTQVMQGSPETGYAGTWTDPATGDIITSVIAPTPPANQNSQSYPIIIEPDVSGGNWGSYDYGYSGGYGSGNGGWPQWPSSPGGYGPGYGPAPYPGWTSPGITPPPPPQGPGFGHGGPPPGMIHPPVGQFPQPPHPGYRPLRPNNPPLGMNPPPGMAPPPGMITPPGMTPPPGMVPPPPMPGGGWQPGILPPPPPNNPGSLWRPGMNRPMGPPPGHWGRPGPHHHMGPPPGGMGNFHGGPPPGRPHGFHPWGRRPARGGF